MAHNYFDPFGGLDSQSAGLSVSLLPDETEDDDLFQCGKCKKQFHSLTDFVSHKQTACALLRSNPVYSSASVLPPPYQSNLQTTGTPTSEHQDHKELSPGLDPNNGLDPTNGAISAFIVSDDFFTLTPYDQNSTGQQGGLYSSSQSNPILSQASLNDSVRISTMSSPTVFSGALFSRSNNSAFTVLPQQAYDLSVVDSITDTTELNEGNNLHSTQILSDRTGLTIEINQASNFIDSSSLDGLHPQHLASHVLPLTEYGLDTGQILIRHDLPVSTSTTTGTVIKPKAARPTSVKKDGYALLQTSPELQALGYSKPTVKPDPTSQTRKAKDTTEEPPPKLRCQYCDKPFSKNFDLHQHVRSHTGEKPFQCIVCGRAFAQKSNVKKHMQTHKVWPKGHKTLPLDPIVVLEERQDLQETITDKSGVKVTVDNSYQCQYCDQVFSSYFKLKSHMKDHKNEQVYKCIYDKCGETFAQLDTFLEHTKTHDSHMAYQCHMCNKEFNGLFDLGVHQYSHSLYPNQGSTPGPKEFKCTLCNNKYTSAQALRHHMETTSHKFPCTQCSKTFPCERFLRRHIAIHASDAEYQCTTCLKKFKTEHYLRIHQTVHSTDFMFSCDICKAAFNRKDKLKRHRLIHDPVKKFKCPFRAHTGCDKSFTRQDKLKAHIISHSGIKPFKCPKCGKEFSRRPHLNEHLKKHIGEYRFRCEACNKGFYRTNLFHSHTCRPSRPTKSQISQDQTTDQVDPDTVIVQDPPDPPKPTVEREEVQEGEGVEDGEEMEVVVSRRSRRPIIKPKKLVDEIDVLPLKPQVKTGQKRPIGRPRKHPVTTTTTEVLGEEQGVGDEGDRPPPLEPILTQEVKEENVQQQVQQLLVGGNQNLRLVQGPEGSTYIYDCLTEVFLAQVTGLSWGQELGWGEEPHKKDGASDGGDLQGDTVGE